MQFPFSRSIRLRVARLLKPIINLLGFHLLIDDFYTPIPSLSEISPSRFNQPPLPYNYSPLALDFFSQSLFLNKILSPLHFNYWNNPGLSSLDSFVLHSIISSRSFNNVIEIGAGHSTFIIENSIISSNLCTSHLVIDPYPSRKVLNLQRPGLSVIPKRIQDCSLDIFKTCDFLFIDSSHVLKTDSDCMFELFEILPVLPKGCIVHFHDIMIPFAYWRDWHISGHQYWNESYFLHAFLSFNSQWTTLYAARAFQSLYPEGFNKLFSSYPSFGRHTSYYIQKQL